MNMQHIGESRMDIGFTSGREIDSTYVCRTAELLHDRQKTADMVRMAMRKKNGIQRNIAETVIYLCKDMVGIQPRTRVDKKR